jgi:XisI protein
MDKLKKYQIVIKEVLEAYRQQFLISSHQVRNQIIVDENNHHYQFLWMGWKDDKQIFNVAIHIELVEDGKIWIQRDNTEVGIATLLAEKGIPKSDIVLGYFPVTHRKYTEYAVA